MLLPSIPVDSRAAERLDVVSDISASGLVDVVCEIEVDDISPTEVVPLPLTALLSLEVEG